MDVKQFFEGDKKDQKRPLRFWARCPKCKKSFGIPPKYAVKFLQRAMEENQEELDAVVKEVNGEGGA